MAVRIPRPQPEDFVGKEERVQLAGEPSVRFHGSLTHRLLEVLQRVDPSRASLDDLEHLVRKKFEKDISVQVAAGARGQPVFANNALHARASELVARVEMKRVCQIIADLEEVIKRREQQGDYWPEGRLNLGIAYACLGKYDDARRWLDDAVNMLRYPSYVPRSEQMKA